MAVTSKMFGQFLMKALNGEVNITSHTIKLALYTGTIPATAQDSWVYKADISTITEVTGTGYTAGGTTLSGVSATYDSASNLIKVDANDVVFSNSTISSTVGILYDDTPATNKPVICYIDFGQSMVSSNGNFSIVFDSAGIITISTT